MKTKERLTQALIEAGAPAVMIEKAKAGEYDDYEAVDTATPCIDLYNACKSFGLTALAERVKNGEFDATPEESDAWWEREGRNICPPAMRGMFERKKQ